MIPASVLLIACTPASFEDRHAPHETVPGAPPTPRDEHTTSPYDPPPATTEVVPTGDCPPGVVCVATFPFVHAATTVGAPSELDAYGCDPSIDEGGGEVLYRLTVPERGFLSATLSGVGGDVDVDLHLLGSRDAADCLDRGHWEAASFVEAGDWWVAADTWVDGEGTALAGEYTVRFELVAPDAVAGADPAALGRALWAFDRAWDDGDATRLRLMAADFDRPSDERRLWVLDLATGEVLFEELVSHGEGSSDAADPALVARMSNVDGSHASSVGVMRASEPYFGDHGYSMRLDGLEPGFDDAVRPRAIVVHNADYATQEFADDHGYLGESWGCAVVDPDVSEDLIDALRDGGLFVSGFSDPDWLAESAYVGDFAP